MSLQSALPEEFAFHPSTWLLPDEMPLFLQALHRAQTRLLGVSSRPGDIHAGSRSHYLLARDIYLAGSLDVGVDRALNGPPPPMVSFRSSFPRRFDLPDHLALPSSRTRIRLPTYIIKPSSGTSLAARSSGRNPGLCSRA